MFVAGADRDARIADGDGAVFLRRRGFPPSESNQRQATLEERVPRWYACALIMVGRLVGWFKNQ
jgi:hypothetical protein